MKKFSFFSIFSFVCALALCISSAYLISTLLVSSSVFGKNITISVDEQNFYAISIFKSQVESETKSVVTNYQKQNCAGYIYCQDEYNYLLTSIYENQNDAELVKSNLETNGHSVDIIEINLPKKEISGLFSAEQKNGLEKCLAVQKNIFLKLYDVSISLDTGIYDKLKAKLTINEIFSDFITTQNNFLTLIENNKDSQLIDIKENLNIIYNKLLTLTSENYLNDIQTFSSLIKYTYCDILLG